MIIIVIVSFLMLLGGIIERAVHYHNIYSIPLRIHVNGTRGKSSTTRLIAGALREAGYRVVAKTTGTAARLITVDGSEVALQRRGVPRIIEQKGVASFARKQRAEVLVVECMAISPEMQWTSEQVLLRTNIGLIINVRQDHLEEMGYQYEDIARVLSLTIPRNGSLITADRRHLEYFTGKALRVGTTVHMADQLPVSEEELARFPYPVFAENAACAFKVCSLLGVAVPVALKGMAKAAPDPGVSRVYLLKRNGRRYFLVNAFAANDYTSTMMVWEKYSRKINSGVLKQLTFIGVFNNRRDRLIRVRDLIRVVENIGFDFIYLMGEMASLPGRQLVKKGFENEIRVIKRSLSECAGGDFSGSTFIETFFNRLEDDSRRDTVLLGFGNIKGPGLQLVDYFRENGEVF